MHLQSSWVSIILTRIDLNDKWYLEKHRFFKRNTATQINWSDRALHLIDFLIQFEYEKLSKIKGAKMFNGIKNPFRAFLLR